MPKITELPVAPAIAATDLAVTDDGTTTYKATVQQLADAVLDAVSPVPIEKGGTGLTASPSLRVNLARGTADTILKPSPQPGVIGILPVVHGGTGASGAEAAKENLGVGADIAAAIEPLSEQIEALEENKASISGTYPQLSVGTAEAIIGDVISTDSTPYLLRPSKSGASVRESLEIVGGTVAWNQLINLENAPGGTSQGITFTKNADGSFTLTGTATGNNVFLNLNYTAGANNLSFSKDHVYYQPKGNTSTHQIGLASFGDSRDHYSVDGDTIFKVEASAINTGWMRIQVSGAANTDIGTVKVFPQLFDLTKYFAADPRIADYAYSLEQSTAGSGIAWLKSQGFDFSEYHDFNAGELMSVKTSAHVMRDADNNIIGNYPLGSDELRGLFKLDGDKIVADGDVKTSDGTVTRKYGIVDLGTLSWTHRIEIMSGMFSAGGLLNNSSALQMAVCSKYVYGGTVSGIRDISEDKKIYLYSSGGTVYVYDSAYTDAATFKSAMSGVMLVYELATPTTEQSTPFSKYQIVSPEGTEEFVDERVVAVPVGNNTKYHNTAQLPVTPTASGTYILKATVTDGIPSFAWVAE